MKAAPGGEEGVRGGSADPVSQQILYPGGGGGSRRRDTKRAKGNKKNLGYLFI